MLVVAGTIQRGEGAFARRLMTVGPGCCADSSDAIQSQRVWDQPGAGARVRRQLLMSRFVSRDNGGGGEWSMRPCWEVQRGCQRERGWHATCSSRCCVFRLTLVRRLNSCSTCCAPQYKLSFRAAFMVKLVELRRKITVEHTKIAMFKIWIYKTIRLKFYTEDDEKEWNGLGGGIKIINHLL